MSAETQLYAALTAGSPTSAIVDLVGDVIYPVRVPQGQGLPAIAYQRIATEYDRTIHTNVPITRMVTFDLFCVSSSYSQAEALGDLVEALTEIRVINRTSTVDEEENGPFATVLTVEVDVE